MKDSALRRDVVDELEFEPYVDANDIGMVAVQAGIVTLTGNLEWSCQKEGAGDVIRHIEGVRGVDNFATLAPKPASLDVKKRIKEALGRYAEVEADKIQVLALGNQVTLKGTVRALADRSSVGAAAWATPGVQSVEHRLTVS